MKKLMIVSAKTALTACQKPAEQTASAGRGFDVQTLFTKDGCTVYRFYDDRTIYFTNCNGSTHMQESCGKNCTQDRDVSGFKVPQ